MTNVYRFTVEFDPEVWSDLSQSERDRWVSDTWDAVSDRAYCSDAEPVK